MSKSSKAGGTKNRGRTSITDKATGRPMDRSLEPVRPTKPSVPEVLRAEANRPVTAGVKHRGDRRDTSKAYTNNTRHKSRGSNARPDVSTRKR